MKIAFLAALCAALAGPALADQEREHAFAIEFLDRMQVRTFRAGVEFCGYFGYDTDGKLVATKPNRGRAASCITRRIPVTIDVFASYHSHGTYDPDYDNETPSYDDMISDIEEGTDGYVSTPGGRVWFIDSSEEAAHQLCGAGCILVDKGFRRDPFWPVPERITRKELERRDGK